MKVAFYTLGCKVNQYETEAMRALLEDAGYEIMDAQKTIANVDCIIINSCTVTSESDRKLRQLLRRCRRVNPNAIVILTGCMPQAFPADAKSLSEADIILGNAERNALPEHLQNYLSTRKRIISIPVHSKEIEPLSIRSFSGHTRAFVKIQDGCNRFCSYCIIPYARGRVRSREPEDIQKELLDLAKKGYREVVLVGINLTAYGQDNGKTIADAVDAACAVEGITRVRLGSLEPDYMSDDILARFAKQPKLCPQFHIALQSGCDATLKRMNRHYSTEEFAGLCDKLRALFPNCALTTDIMVGFPGESDEEFENSLSFVKKIAFSRLHVFAYSRRVGTVADKLPQQVSTAVKNTRSRRMTAVGKAAAESYALDYIGKTVEVLLETVNDDGTVTGLTDTYLTVRTSTTHKSGETILVRICATEGETLIGEEI